MIDAFYHAYFKKTLTGIKYIKHWFGPVPDVEAFTELYRMEFDKIKVTRERLGNKVKNAHYAMKDPDYSTIPPRAIEIIRDVALFITGKQAGKLSNITHDDVYENTPMGAEIPIESVYSRETDTATWLHTEKSDAKKILEEIHGSGEFDLSPFYAQA